MLVGLIVCFCFAGFLVATAKANADTGAPPEMPTYDVDVVVFGSQTSGIAAVREITLADPSLRIAFVSCGNLLETPLAQGLSVEDTRDGGNPSRLGMTKGHRFSSWSRAPAGQGQNLASSNTSKLGFQ